MKDNSLGTDTLSMIKAFESNSDLAKYGQMAWPLFALDLYLRLDDIDEFASESLTDSPNDKRIDVCHIDLEEGRIIICQSYFAASWGKAEASARKASDLNTAISWLFSGDYERIPARLQAKAIEIRSAIIAGDIRHIELLFINNCLESTNVADELKAVANMTKGACTTLGGSDAERIGISYQELGLNTIQELYRSRDSDIMIDGWLILPRAELIAEQSDKWKGFVTTIQGNWIRSLYEEHGDRLFSANFRDYLGTIQRKGNINYEIQQTVKSESENFWVYNNGITAITNEIQVNESEIRLRGISIVNGAQTSGALRDSDPTATEQVRVICRVIECKDKDLIDSIIRYNNTQNEIRPADRRSKDQRQKRLHEGFAKYNITYLHRRDASSRNIRGAFTASTAAPSLCAFHGDVQTAYRNAKDIFGIDRVYDKVFRHELSPEHLFLVYTLSQAITKYKLNLRTKISEEEATDIEIQQYEILKFSMSKHFVLFLIGSCAEEIMGIRIPDRYKWKVLPEHIRATSENMTMAWQDVLQVIVPQIEYAVSSIQTSPYDAARSSDESRRVAQLVRTNLTSLQRSLASSFQSIRLQTHIQ